MCVSAETAENIKSIVRVRPASEREVADGEGVYRKSVEVSGNSLTYEGAKPFTFDGCCDEDSTQEQIFEQVGKPMTDSCLDGYNGTSTPHDHVPRAMSISTPTVLPMLALLRSDHICLWPDRLRQDVDDGRCASPGILSGCGLPGTAAALCAWILSACLRCP
jgi:hypothetical protein